MSRDIFARVSVCAVVLALAFVPAALAQSWESVEGTWQSSEGTMHMEQTGYDVMGHYDQDEGRILGTIDGRVLTGVWIERSSNITCPDMRDGSNHWGPVTLTYNQEVTAFTGRWAYCDGTSGGAWTGTRVDR